MPQSNSGEKGSFTIKLIEDSMTSAQVRLQLLLSMAPALFHDSFSLGACVQNNNVPSH